jgi:hypothetical protein
MHGFLDRTSKQKRLSCGKDPLLHDFELIPIVDRNRKSKQAAKMLGGWGMEPIWAPTGAHVQENKRLGVLRILRLPTLLSSSWSYHEYYLWCDCLLQDRT